MFASLGRTLRFLSGRQRLAFGLLVSARALTGVLDVAGIVLIGVLASAGATAISDSSGPTEILGFTLPVLSEGDLLWLAAGVLGVFVVKALLATGISLVLTRFIAHLETDAAEELSRLMLYGSLDEAKRQSKAEFQYALTGSLTYTFTGILNATAILVTEGFLLLVVSATFFFVDPVAAIAALIYFGLIILAIQFGIGRNLRRAGIDSAEGTIDTGNYVADILDTFREISVVGRQGFFVKRLRAARGRVARSGGVQSFLAGMPRYIVETALMLGIVAFVGVLFVSGQLATGLLTVGVFLTGGVRIMASLLPLQSAVLSIRQTVEQARPAQAMLAEAREVRTRQPRPAPVARDDDRPAVAVELDRVSFRYPGDAHDTIRDVTLSIRAGDHVAVVGPSGAGKTTLVDLILGLIEPTGGEVRVDGVDPVVARGDRAVTISYVPQRPGIVSGTILDNVALGVEPADVDRARATEVMEAAFLGDFLKALPDGLDSSVGKQVDSMSGGQMQRLGLARALYTRPQLLVLDEATSGLDAGSEAFVSQTLRGLHGSVTAIVIAHRLSTVQHSDVVNVIDGGRLIASGDFRTVRATVPMIAEYVKLMSFDES